MKWKEIYINNQFTGYKISSNGLVYNILGQLIKPFVTKTNYLEIHLQDQDNHLHNQDKLLKNLTKLLIRLITVTEPLQGLSMIKKCLKKLKILKFHMNVKKVIN